MTTWGNKAFMQTFSLLAFDIKGFIKSIPKKRFSEHKFRPNKTLISTVFVIFYLWLPLKFPCIWEKNSLVFQIPPLDFLWSAGDPSWSWRALKVRLFQFLASRDWDFMLRALEHRLKMSICCILDWYKLFTDPPRKNIGIEVPLGQILQNFVASYSRTSLTNIAIKPKLVKKQSFYTYIFGPQD